MRIVQLNIWGGKLKHQIKEFLDEQDADIACFQEVFDYDGSGGSYLGMLRSIAGSRYKHRFLSPTYSTSFMNQNLDYGIATISKFTLLNQKTIFLKGDFVKNFNIKKDDYNTRNFQHSTIKNNGKTVNIINLHGYHSLNKNGDEESARQLKIVIDFIESLSGPVILCGDFNLDVKSDNMTIFDKTNLINLTRDNRIASTLSSLHYYKGDVACDYIFVSPDVEVNSFKTFDRPMSDHKALVLDFDV